MFLNCRIGLWLSVCLIGTTHLSAQDKIISLRGTEERVTEGLILGTTSDGSPRIRTADGVETTVKISEVLSIIKTEPSGIIEARKAFQDGEYDKAISQAGPVAEQFSGLPVYWAVEAFGIVADSYLLKGDKENARSWYNKISQAYGQTQYKMKGEIGLARLALLDGDNTTAEKTVRALVQQATSTLRPSPVESQVYANAFFLMGKIQEKNQMYSDALACYLRIPALYPDNPTLVNQALEAAARLKTEKKAIVN